MRNKSEMDVKVPFLLDAVVTHLEIFGKRLSEPLALEGNLNFMGMSVNLTSSRMNVTEFVANREEQFILEPKTVRKRLENMGISLAVTYQGSPLGTAIGNIPTQFLDKISPTMSDLLYNDTLDINRGADVVGKVSIHLRLTIKCDQVPVIAGSLHQSKAVAVDQQEKGSRVNCADQGSNINPQDVMFLLGDPDPLLQIPSDPCSELAAEEGEERLRLDLQRYQSLCNRRVIFPDDDPCPRQKPSLSQLKKLSKEYSQIMDSVAEKVKHIDCATRSVSATACVTNIAKKTTPSISKDDRWIPVPVRSEPEELPGVKPIRHCPVCLNAMSWLPKYTPCPNCNTKSRPVLPPQDAKDELTALQIMAEQMERSRESKEGQELCLDPCDPRRFKNLGSEGDKCPPCHCTCSARKICAHCRVRRICEDIYERPPVAKPRIQLPEQRSDEDFCVVAESQDDDLPYLSRVFYEMKHLYELHDSQKLSSLQMRCQSQTLLRKRSIKELTEALYQGGRTRSQTCRMHDQCLKLGHKRCLPPDSVVSRRHGWNWTTSNEARTKGWRPGAILRASGQVMRYFLMRGPERNLCQRIAYDIKTRQRMADPVLNVCKRNGEIFVTLRPLANQGIRQKPITFRIVKSQLAVALRQIKRSLKDQGFEKCVCHKSLMLCTCRDALEKFELNKALRKECRSRLMEPCPEHLVLSDTSISDVELNLDISPPARSSIPQVKAIRSTVNHGTQTSRKEQLPMPLQYTKEVPPYYRAFDCALGDRYMGTAFGRPGEQVFEDGVFGMDGGGPHGPNPMPCGRPRSAKAWGGGAGGGQFRGGNGRRHGASGPGGIYDHGVPGGGAWMGFQGGKGRRGKGKGDKSGPMPVRYPKRMLKPAQDAAKAAKKAERDALEKKKKGTDMIKYLQQKGVMRRPWNANEGKDTRPRPQRKSRR